MNIEEIIAQETEGARIDKMIAEEQAKVAQSSASSSYQDEYEDVDPMANRSGTDKFLSGIGGGMASVVQGVGNMVGLVDDESIARRKRIAQPLMDTGWGKVGQFAGETLALSPLGAISAVTKLGKVGKVLAKSLKRVPAPLKGKLAQAVAQGGAAGAILADPNERGTGAAIGAVTSGGLHKAGSGIGRLFKDGMVKKTPSALALSKAIERTTGRTPFIPLSQAADASADALSARGKSTADLISLLPSARAKFEKQGSALADDTYEMLLRSGFKGRESGPKASQVLRRSGDVSQALDAAKASLKGKGPLTKTQQVISDAAEGVNRGRFTPQKLLRASAKQGKLLGTKQSEAPLRYEATIMDDVLSRNLGSSSVESRDLYHKMGNMLGWAADKVPGLGPLLGSELAQKALMGDASLQRALVSAVNSGQGKAVMEVAKAIRVAASAQLTNSTNVPSYIQDLGE